MQKKKKKEFRAIKTEKFLCSIILKHYAPRKGEIAQIFYALKNPSVSKEGPMIIKRRKFEKWQLRQKGANWRRLSNGISSTLEVPFN
jgi:hypothetical protein